MPKIDTNFDDVPDEILPLPEGRYVLDIVGTPTIEDVVGKPGNRKLVVVMAVVEGPNGSVKDANRKIFDNISLKLDTRIKRLALSCGLKPGADGLETEELTGRRLSAIVKTNSYQDPKTMEQRENSKIAEYIIPET